MSFSGLYDSDLLKQKILKRGKRVPKGTNTKNSNTFFSSHGQRPMWAFAITWHPSSSVHRKLSHLNLLLWNLWTKLNQTCQRWSLGGSLSKCVRQTRPPFKMAAVTKNRNFFSCQFLLHCKSKWTQILTAMAKSRLTYILGFSVRFFQPVYFV